MRATRNGDVCLLWLSVAVIGWAGCGPRTTLEKVVVTGEVTFQGEPIGNGQIYFYPAPGTRGPVSGAPIKDGKYRAAAKGGVPVGSHQVKIEGFRARAAAAEADMTSGPAGAPEQYIPPQFNQHTTLQVDVPGENSSFVQNFDLLNNISSPR